MILENLVIDILAGLDITMQIPINSVILYARIDQFALNVEKYTVESFSKVLSYTNEMMDLKVLENIRPMFRPLTKTFISGFSQRHNLNQENYTNIKLL